MGSGEGDAPCAALVRVVITTFNHEDFIAQALESVLAQETSFPVEIVVIDDCSTDGTPAELDRLAEVYPGRFEVRRTPHNRNDLQAFGTALDECTSPYLAMLDGDDYWISTRKLARQVSFLEANPEFAIASHAVLRVNRDGSPTDLMTQASHSARYTRDDLWYYCYFQAGTVVFRRSCFDRLPDWYYESVGGDRELYLLLMLHGDAWFAHEPMSAYRQHADGAWSGLSPVEQARQMEAFYRHQERAWGRGFRANRAAMLSRAMALEAYYGQAGMRLRAWRWAAEAAVRAVTTGAGNGGASRRDVRRMLSRRVRSAARHLARAKADR